MPEIEILVLRYSRI